MKFSIGDKVVMKKTDEEGVVTALIGNDMVEIEVKGTTFPTYVDELDHPYLRWFTQKKKAMPKTVPEQLPVESKRFKSPKLAKGIYLSFMPVFKADEIDDIVEQLKIYLVNELPHTVQYSYDVQLLGSSHFRLEGKITEFSNIYLHTLPYEAMNDQPRFNWRLDDLSDPALAALDGQVRIKPVKLFEHINQLLAKNEPSFSYLLADGFYPARFERPDVFDAPQAKPKLYPKSKGYQPMQHTIDLHIEQLVDDRTGLSNTEMLQIQLEALERFMQEAIANRQQRVVVIHGVGEGVLKDEVHRYLRTLFEVTKFKNDWMSSYGFGATEVFMEH
jgi:DNA-nicking Smr family endonuclease